MQRPSHRLRICRCQSPGATEVADGAEGAAESVEGHSAAAAPAGAGEEEAPPTMLRWADPSPARKALTQLYLSFALPWRRFKSGSYLALRLEGVLFGAAGHFVRR